jgi:hypothetical protein
MAIASLSVRLSYNSSVRRDIAAQPSAGTEYGQPQVATSLNHTVIVRHDNIGVEVEGGREVQGIKAAQRRVRQPCRLPEGGPVGRGEAEPRQDRRDIAARYPAADCDPPQLGLEQVAGNILLPWVGELRDECGALVRGDVERRVRRQDSAA